MLNKILAWFWTRISLFSLRYIYRTCSRVWRFLFERKYKEMPKNLPWDVRQVLEFFATCKWKRDPLWGTLDVISKPEKFYATKTGDCDEWAAFAANVLPYENMWLLSVTWYEPKTDKHKRAFTGHNVCLYYNNLKWYHIGNWGLYGPYKYFHETLRSIPPSWAVPCAFGVRDGKSLKVVISGQLDKT